MSASSTRPQVGKYALRRRGLDVRDSTVDDLVARTRCPPSGSVLLCHCRVLGNGDTATRPARASVGAAGRIVPEGSTRGSMMIVRAVH